MTQIPKLFLWRQSAIIAAIALAPSLAWADEELPADEASTGQREQRALFGQLDANSDDRITSDEIAEDQNQLFARLLRQGDSDKDGELTQEEFASGLKSDRRRKRRNADEESSRRGPPPGERPSPERIFERLDADEDGRLTIDEVPEPRREGFRHLVDRAGGDAAEGLTVEEFRRVLGAVRREGPPQKREPRRPEAKERDRAGDREENAQRGRRGGEDGPPRRRPGERERYERYRSGGPERRPPRPHLFIALDRNDDGTLSKKEIKKAAKSLKKLDRNDDGEISPRELMPSVRRGGPPRDDARRLPDGPPRGDARRPRRGPPRGEARGRRRGPPREEAHRRPGGPPRGDGRQFGSPRDPEAMLRRVMSADEDGDGSISRDEAPERLRERFDRIDADDNDHLDKRELKRAMERFMRQRGRGGDQRRRSGRRPARPARPDGGGPQPEVNAQGEVAAAEV